MELKHIITDAKTGLVTERAYTQEEIDDYNAAAAANAAADARAELAAIDAATIRALREYVAAQPDAPQIIKDREKAAQAARAKIK